MKEIQFKTSLGHLIHSINLKMRRRLEKQIKKYDLVSSHQFGILLLLSKTGASTQKTIANFTLGDEPSTTRLIARLIKQELVTKERNPLDKREQLVSLTAKGKELLMKVTPEAMAANKKIENLLTEEEYKKLMQILDKINENMD